MTRDVDDCPVQLCLVDWYVKRLAGKQKYRLSSFHSVRSKYATNVSFPCFNLCLLFSVTAWICRDWKPKLIMNPSCSSTVVSCCKCKGVISTLLLNKFSKTAFLCCYYCLHQSFDLCHVNQDSFMFHLPVFELDSAVDVISSTSYRGKMDWTCFSVCSPIRLLNKPGGTGDSSAVRCKSHSQH